jgi:DNA-binding PadR family transcriptional regulator
MFQAKTSVDERARAALPLTPVALQILLALSDRRRHGLGIAAEIEATTGGRMMLGPGTLYGAMKRLLDMGLVDEPGDAPKGDSADPRRRYYRLTPVGARALEIEARALTSLLKVARAKRVI